MALLSGNVPCPICDELIDINMEVIPIKGESMSYHDLTWEHTVKADLQPMYDHLLTIHNIKQMED